MSPFSRIDRGRALVAVLCCGRVIDGRRAQVVSERFLEPIARALGAAVIIPAMPDVVDAVAIARRCDALLMTGSCSNLSPLRYGVMSEGVDPDHGRDEVAFRVAEAMISAGRPVLGICRGAHELNVLMGGSLRDLGTRGLHVAGPDWRDPRVFSHRHDVSLESSGSLRAVAGSDLVSVVSAHRQGVDALAPDLVVEARASDGLVEAFSARPRSTVVGVQWHPELGSSRLDAALFENLLLAA